MTLRVGLNLAQIATQSAPPGIASKAAIRPLLVGEADIGLLSPRARLVGSFRLNPKLLEPRPPFLRVGPLQRAERLGALPLARKNLKPEIDEARSHCGIGQRFAGRRV